MASVPIVVCFASIDWAFNWQIPQEVATGLAAAGHRVLYVENTGVRRVGWRDAGRLAHRLGRWWHTRGAPRPITHGVDLLSPLLVPLPYSVLACRANAAWLVRRVRGWIGPGSEDTAIVFLTFLPTPLAAAVCAALAPTIEVYYCCDNFVESSPGARPIAAHEAALMARADVVMTTSEGLQRRAETRTSRAVLLPAGVSAAPFALAADAAHADQARLPAALRGLRRPIAGFIGSLRSALDLRLLAAAARLAPDVTFVLAGPIMADVRELAACRNVVLPGAIPHEAVVDWVAGFDVGLAPYARTPFTDDLMPLKLKEYLAAGLPVVATGLPDLRRFDALHPSLITFAETPAEFVAAIRAVAGHTSPAAVEARRQAARQYDWSRQLTQFRGLVTAALDARAAGAAR